MKGPVRSPHPSDGARRHVFSTDLLADPLAPWRPPQPVFWCRIEAPGGPWAQAASPNGSCLFAGAL